MAVRHVQVLRLWICWMFGRLFEQVVEAALDYSRETIEITNNVERIWVGCMCD